MSPCSYSNHLLSLMLFYIFFEQIEKLEKSNEKLQLSRKKIQEAHTKVQVLIHSRLVRIITSFCLILSNELFFSPQTSVLLDEAKIREDARNVQHKCLEKEHTALKEENKKVRWSANFFFFVYTSVTPVHLIDFVKHFNTYI